MQSVLVTSRIIAQFAAKDGRDSAIFSAALQLHCLGCPEENRVNNPDDLQVISQFLQKQHVLTLCAAHAGEMWCANCFYVFDGQQMALYLMTERHTRHSELMQHNPRVVGTIATQARSVALIKGVQYCGDIKLLSDEADNLARQRYCKRFPIATLASAPIWQLDLQEIKMTNNTLGFGKKLYWMRDPA